MRCRWPQACAAIYPSAANFLCVRFDDAAQAYTRLLDLGIVVRDVSRYSGLDRLPAHHGRHAGGKYRPARSARFARGGGMNARKLLFVDRDGTLIVEPPDQQIDRYEKLALVDGVIPALKRCIAAGYELVMITNQDGLGTDEFPAGGFRRPARADAAYFRLAGHRVSRGADRCEFRAVKARIRASPASDSCVAILPTMAGAARSRRWSAIAKPMRSSRANLGVRSFRLDTGEWNWSAIAHELCDAPRRASVERDTKETRILRASGSGSPAPSLASKPASASSTTCWSRLGKHGGFALSLRCDGDTHIDEHHTIEDCALGARRGAAQGAR